MRADNEDYERYEGVLAWIIGCLVVITIVLGTMMILSMLFY